MLEKNVTLSLKGCVQGAAMCIPVSPGIIALGAAFGTVAVQKGLTFLETLMINSLVFAGASQFVAMEVYSDPLTWGALVAMVGVTGAVNMRMLLIGASLRPWLGRVPAHKTYPALFFLTDLNWLLALSEYNKGTRDWDLSRQRPLHLGRLVAVGGARLFCRQPHFRSEGLRPGCHPAGFFRRAAGAAVEGKAPDGELADRRRRCHGHLDACRRLLEHLHRCDRRGRCGGLPR
ncbi:AzlC family ABC transporter permease [Roseibium salinum]|uniref:AzlC family ABC transporter permease n=1 Tax=Roseibium salinum TaxID=1604349 RepID=UPI00360F2F19